MNCADHVKICRAECCKQFNINIPIGTIIKSGQYTFKADFNDDMVHYLKLHRVIEYRKGEYIIILSKYTREEDKLIIHEKCLALTKDYKCSVHELGSQPMVCRTPNNKGEPLCMGCRVTEHCAYKELYNNENRNKEL